MEFRGELFFLSNLFGTKIQIGELVFENAEAAFQSFKDLKRQKEFEKIDGVTAKRLGKRVNLRNDWTEVKIEIMELVLREKFSNKVLKEKLKATGNVELIETNHWGDYFWGVCNGRGKNELGKLLMKLREEFQDEN